MLSSDKKGVLETHFLIGCADVELYTNECISRIEDMARLSYFSLSRNTIESDLSARARKKN